MLEGRGDGTKEEPAGNAGLSCDEVCKLRRIIAKTRAEEEEQTRIQNCEKVSLLRSRTLRALKSLYGRCRALAEYRGAEYVGHRRNTRTILRLRDGRAIAFGFASHVSGAADFFYETFRFWGFEGPEELYRLPKLLADDEFFDKGIAFVEGLYGKDACGLERLMYEVDREEDLLEMMLLHLKVEDMVAETRRAFAAISERVKKKHGSG